MTNAASSNWCFCEFGVFLSKRGDVRQAVTAVLPASFSSTGLSLGLDPVLQQNENSKCSRSCCVCASKQYPLSFRLHRLFILVLVYTGTGERKHQTQLPNQWHDFWKQLFQTQQEIWGEKKKMEKYFHFSLYIFLHIKSTKWFNSEFIVINRQQQTKDVDAKRTGWKYWIQKNIENKALCGLWFGSVVDGTAKSTGLKVKIKIDLVGSLFDLDFLVGT